MRTFIGLGGNVGDARSAFASAVAELRVLGAVGAVSSLYLSEPRDMRDQPELRMLPWSWKPSSSPMSCSPR